MLLSSCGLACLSSSSSLMPLPKEARGGCQSPATCLPGSCELPDMDTETHTQVLCKNTMCSQPLASRLPTTWQIMYCGSHTHRHTHMHVYTHTFPACGSCGLLSKFLVKILPPPGKNGLCASKPFCVPSSKVFVRPF